MEVAGYEQVRLRSGLGKAAAPLVPAGTVLLAGTRVGS